MTDNEIIKALECSTKKGFCETCKYREKHITDENFYWCESGKTCVNGSAWESAILDLINRQKAEIERLRLYNNLMVSELKAPKAEAIKEFAEELKQRTLIQPHYNDFVKEFLKIIHRNIDNLVKEMVGDTQ